jgi:hypothetical protein
MVRALYENWDEATRHGEEQKNGYLYITHAVLVLARSKKSRIVDHATMLAFDGLLAARDVPDYALDKHTTRGRAKGRGLKHFFEVGTKLENCGLEDPYEARAKAAKVAAPGKVSD